MTVTTTPEGTTKWKGDEGANIGRPVGEMFGMGDVGQGIHEFFMGKTPEAEIVSQSTLTPEQEAMLKQLISQGPINQRDQYDAEGNKIAEANLSLAGVEDLRNKMAQGAVGADGETQTNNSANLLTNIATRGSDPNASAEYFKTATQPLMDQANENLKTVGRDFGGGAGGFFGSERQAQDENVQKAFADAQNQLMATLVREDENRALNAATGLQAGEGQQLDAAKATAQNELALQQLYQQLLGVQGKENIVMNQGGTNGQGGGLLGGLLSDRRLKYDIRPLMKLPIGIDLVSWRWRSNDEWSFGVIAQDLQEVMPEAVVRIGSWLGVNYNMVWAQVSKLWTGGK